MIIDKDSTSIQIHVICMLMVTSGGERVEYRSCLQLNSLNFVVL